MRTNDDRYRTTSDSELNHPFKSWSLPNFNKINLRTLMKRTLSKIEEKQSTIQNIK